MTPRDRPIDKHPNTIIRASAGTGKTYRLAMRYIGLLARDEPPAALLATTFTKKAAGEMLDRVLLFLVDGTRDPAFLAQLRADADPALTSERCAELLQKMVQALPHHNVLNIDKLFYKLASSFTLDLGIAPGWKLEESESVMEELRIEAVAASLKEPPHGVDLLSTLRDFAGGGNPRAVHAPILAGLKDCYSPFCATGGSSEPWMQIGPSTDPLTNTELRAAIERLEAAREHLPTTAKLAVNSNWLKAWQKSIERAQAEDWTGFLGGKLVAACAPECANPAFHSTSPAPKLVAVYRPLISHAISVLLGDLRKRNFATHCLLTGFHEHFTRIKAARGAYQFDDIPRMLLALPWDGERDHLYYKLDARVRHIMLDEFQDTSRMQYQLFEPLVQECITSDDGRTAFVVGDVKQSLYGFRGAEPGLLAGLHERLAGCRVEELSRNFRSSPAIIDAVNTTFAAIGSNRALALCKSAQPAAAAWQAGYALHSSHHSTWPGSVVLRTAGAEDGESTSPDELAQSTALRVKAVQEACPHATLAVLTRRNLPIAALRFHLREIGVESSEEGGSPVTDSPAVAALMALLQLAAFPGDTLARIHIATSPLGEAIGLTDHTDERAAGRLSTRFRGDFLSHGFAAAFRDLRRALLPAITTRDHVRLTQLIDLACDADAAGLRDLVTFKRLVETRKCEDPSPARVRLMTIHAAKGLEFDAVFLPQFDNAWTLKPRACLEYAPDPAAPPVLLTRPLAEELTRVQPQLEAIKSAAYQRMIQEELCAVYVGMTRAKHHLEIIVKAERHRPPDEDRAPSSDRILCEALAAGVERTPETVLHEATFGPIPWPQFVTQRAHTSAPVPPTEVTLRLAHRAATDPLRARRATPSSLEGGESRAAADLLAPRHAVSLDRGTLIHAWFELIGFNDETPPSDAELLAAATKAGIAAATASAHLADFKAMCADPSIGAALARPAGKVKLKREWAFSTPINAAGRMVLLEGRFDRVVIRYREDVPVAAEILDFKTDALQDEEVARRVEHYRPQLEAYRAALSSLLDLPESEITCRLLFVTLRRAETVGGSGSGRS